jgi:hypothetical protein
LIDLNTFTSPGFYFHRVFHENFVNNSVSPPNSTCTTIFSGQRGPWEGSFIDRTWRLKNESGRKLPLSCTLEPRSETAVRDVKASIRVRFVDATYEDTLVGISYGRTTDTESDSRGILLARNCGSSVSIIQISSGRFIRVWSKSIEVNDTDFAELKLVTLQGRKSIRFFMDESFLHELPLDEYQQTSVLALSLVALGHGEVAFSEICLDVLVACFHCTLTMD